MGGIRTPRDFTENPDPDDEGLIVLFVRAVAILAAGFGTSRINNDESFVQRAKRFERYVMTGE